MIRQTSIDAYHQEKERNLTKKQEVHNLIKILGTATDHELMQASKWPRNIVSARRRELVLEGVVIEDGLRFDVETRKNVIVWKLKP